MIKRATRNAALILHAQIAAERLIERTQSERGAVMSLSRDELRALAEQLRDVSDLASRMHIEKATAGSLPPDSFPGPTT